MNIIDRAVGFVNPRAGLARAHARIVLDQFRSYDGAKGGRRAGDWTASNASANVTIKGALPRLRARSRDVMRNTWWGSRIRTVFVSHAIGTGIMPKPKSADPALNREIKLAWKRWGKARFCDAEGQTGINGMMALATGSILESGEVLTRFVPVPLVDKRIVPLELQLLEPDHLDTARDRVMSADAIVDQGIEYSAHGKRKGYWILPTHPGARGLVMPGASVRIDARDMLHAYRKERIGQGRGVPWVAPVIMKGRDIADLEETIVVKARVEACLAAFVKTTDQTKTIGAAAKREIGPNGTRRIEQLAPAMINYLDPGEDIVTVSPSSTANFDSVLKSNWMTLAAGAGITYDQLTGDLSGANYSSLKAGKIEFRRIVEQFQHLTFVEMWLEPLWERWLRTAVDAGVLPEAALDCEMEWIMPANEPIDPLKDMEADIAAVRSGRMTWPQFVAGWGIDPDTQMDEIVAWIQTIDKHKLTLTADARVPINGAAKRQEDANDDPRKS